MPLEHAEDKVLCARMLTELDKVSDEVKAATPELHEEGGVGKMIAAFHKFGVSHNDTVQQFGRYPHRNEVLGRESTPEEVEYLKTANRYGQ